LKLVAYISECKLLVVYLCCWLGDWHDILPEKTKNSLQKSKKILLSVSYIYSLWNRTWSTKIGEKSRVVHG